MNRRLHNIGAGGHAKVIIATARAAGFLIDTVWDEDTTQWGDTLMGALITGTTEKKDDDPAPQSVCLRVW